MWRGDMPKWLLWLIYAIGGKLGSGYLQSLDDTAWINCINCGEYISDSVSENFLTICPNCGYGYMMEIRARYLPRVDWLTRNMPKLEGK